MKWPEDADFFCSTEWDEDLYQKALIWVQQGKRAAFLSDCERTSSDPRVKIYVLESVFHREIVYKQIAWSAVLQKLFVIGQEASLLEEFHRAANLILSEASDFWVKPFENARMNLKRFRRGSALKGVFRGVPAVVIGAGPSLKKDLELLAPLKKKALLFAAGSALNFIQVEPHFAGSIDANAPFREHPFSNVPFCYQARTQPEILSYMKGEKLLFGDSSCRALNWIYGEELFDGGWTVGNFMTRIAYEFGCSPIFLVGMDGSYQEGEKYAGPVSEKSEGLVKVGDVWTQNDWLMAAKWTEELGKKANLIDTCEKGILRLPKEPLKTCLELEDLQVSVEEAILSVPFEEARWSAWEGDHVHEELLMPLWEIWKPVFEREVEQDLKIHQKIFFQSVLEEHEAVLQKRLSLL